MKCNTKVLKNLPTMNKNIVFLYCICFVEVTRGAHRQKRLAFNFKSNSPDTTNNANDGPTKQPSNGVSVQSNNRLLNGFGTNTTHQPNNGMSFNFNNKPPVKPGSNTDVTTNHQTNSGMSFNFNNKPPADRGGNIEATTNQPPNNGMSFNFNNNPPADTETNNDVTANHPPNNGMSFNFNNNPPAGPETNTDVTANHPPNNGMSFDDFPVDDPQTNTDSTFNCPQNLCDIYNPCTGLESCVQLPNCQGQECANASDSDLALASPGSGIPPELLNVTLRPMAERACQNDTFFACVHGYCDVIRPQCYCDDKWRGDFCEQPCWLSCDHGVCSHRQVRARPEQYSDEDLECNCEYGWTGDTCHERIPDPEESARQAKVLIVTMTVVIIVLILVLIIVPVLLWRRRVIFIMKVVYMLKDYEDDDGKVFDAYVSMSPTRQAEDFVYNSLRPHLEDRGFKLYLPARDQPVGGAQSDTILQAVYRSRRTILVVNPDYVENEWNRFEFLIAQHETLKLKQRIIPVILQELSEETKNKDRTLKHILESVKCLSFPNKVTSGDTGCFLGCASKQKGKTHPDRHEAVLENRKSKFWKRLELTMPKKKSADTRSLLTHCNFLNSRGKFDLSKPGIEGGNSSKPKEMFEAKYKLKNESNFNDIFDVANDKNHTQLAIKTDNSFVNPYLADIFDFNKERN